MKVSVCRRIRIAFRESYPLVLPEWAERLSDTYQLVRWASSEEVVKILPHQLEDIVTRGEAAALPQARTKLVVDALPLLIILDISESGLEGVSDAEKRVRLFDQISEAQSYAILVFLCWFTSKEFSIGMERELVGAMSAWSARCLRR